jgi:hypothetical protein
MNKIRLLVLLFVLIVIFYFALLPVEGTSVTNTTQSGKPVLDLPVSSLFTIEEISIDGRSDDGTFVSGRLFVRNTGNDGFGTVVIDTNLDPSDAKYATFFLAQNESDSVGFQIKLDRNATMLFFDVVRNYITPHNSSSNCALLSGPTTSEKGGMRYKVTVEVDMDTSSIVDCYVYFAKNNVKTSVVPMLVRFTLLDYYQKGISEFFSCSSGEPVTFSAEIDRSRSTCDPAKGFCSVSTGQISCQPLPALTGDLYVTSAPSGANVYLDGTYKGIAPITISQVSEGSHTIKCTKSGYYDYSKSVYVTAGTTTSVNCPMPTTPQPEEGKIFVMSDPTNANVRITRIYDNKLVGSGRTPYEFSTELPIGYTFRVTVGKEGYQMWERNVHVNPTDIETQYVSLVKMCQEDADCPSGMSCILQSGCERWRR